MEHLIVVPQIQFTEMVSEHSGRTKFSEDREQNQKRGATYIRTQFQKIN